MRVRVRVGVRVRVHFSRTSRLKSSREGRYGCVRERLRMASPYLVRVRVRVKVRD